MLKQPKLIPVPEEGVYMLHGDYEHLDVCVPGGFTYDGASIPSFGWLATFTPFDPHVMAPALVHDWVYYNHQMNRARCDLMFFHMLVANYVPDRTAWIMFQAVRLAGKPFWDNVGEDLSFLAELYIKIKDRENYPQYKFPEGVLKC